MARILVTAGPTYEPIDAVRYLGNRSSGKLGSNLADCAAELGWEARILLGPNSIQPMNPAVNVVRFESSQNLEDALQQHFAWCDCLVMAAAVADYRPKPGDVDQQSKRRRTGEDLSLTLEATPDLLAQCSRAARANQLLVGFALEPIETLIESAHRKLVAKNIDLIVANPLETMNADTIDARLIGNPDRGIALNTSTDGQISKPAFAHWLLSHLDALVAQRRIIEHPTMEPTNHVEL